jgi:hypothetical protein
MTPSTMYAGTAAGIFQSLDAGGKWRALAPDLYATAMAMDPGSPSTLYAGTHLGVIKSLDSGSRWAPLRMAASSQVEASALPPLPVVQRRTPEERPLRPLPVIPRRAD